MSDLIAGATAPDIQPESNIQSGADVMDAEVFGDLWSHVMENYTGSDAELLKAYIALRGVCAILEKELGIGRIDVSVDDEGSTE
jgi:hypothetical protein